MARLKQFGVSPIRLYCVFRNDKTNSKTFSWN